MVHVSTYDFQLPVDNLQEILDGLASRLDGTISKQYTFQRSGQPGLGPLIVSPVWSNGTTDSIGYMAVLKGNRTYQLLWQTRSDRKSNMDEVDQFFASFKLN